MFYTRNIIKNKKIIEPSKKLIKLIITVILFTKIIYYIQIFIKSNINCLTRTNSCSTQI